MYNFKNDYNKGCHEKIIRRLEKENDQQFDGYGEDTISSCVKEKIKGKLKNWNCDIHFFSGGTQTNLTTIASILKPHQGVLSAITGHINTHETGAIEATGHQIISIETKNGKITAKQIEDKINIHYNDESFEHMVQPGMVYISNPTELGTIYRKDELLEINKVCKKYKIPLYIDGARLASALTAKENDVKISDLCNLCDVFYIGGTKCGALMGECLVIVNEIYQKDFRYIMKQKGALLAKSFILAIQFDELFTNNLYFELGKYENYLAEKMSTCLEGKIFFLQKQYTNQIFPILSNEKIKTLRKKYSFFVWEKIDLNNSAIRICLSWGTNEKIVDELIEDILR